MCNVPHRGYYSDGIGRGRRFCCRRAAYGSGVSVECQAGIGIQIRTNRVGDVIVIRLVPIPVVRVGVRAVIV